MDTPDSEGLDPVKDEKHSTAFQFCKNGEIMNFTTQREQFPTRKEQIYYTERASCGDFHRIVRFDLPPGSYSRRLSMDTPDSEGLDPVDGEPLPTTEREGEREREREGGRGRERERERP